jgi:hypothetical protein
MEDGSESDVLDAKRNEQNSRVELVELMNELVNEELVSG